MNVDDVIIKLQALSQQAKQKVQVEIKYFIPLWDEMWKLKKNVEVKVLSLEEAGKAVKIITSAFIRKPDSEWISIKGYKQVTWNVGSSIKKQRMANQAAAELYLSGIYDFGVSSKKYGMFFINIPEDCYVSVFSKSDDPEEWKKENSRKADLRRVNQVVRKLDKV